jgi:hypothetical protein
LLCLVRSQVRCHEIATCELAIHCKPMMRTSTAAHTETSLGVATRGRPPGAGACAWRSAAAVGRCSMTCV